MREIQINLSTTGTIIDNVSFSVGATAKTVDEETCFYNYFFFTATSINFKSSTMALKYEEYPGWTPEAWLAICNQDVARETYAIKIKTPKYSSSTSGIESRTVYAVGNIQTESPSVNSDYNIAVRTNACPEVEDYRLLYVTNKNDDETYTIMNSRGMEENIVFNVQYVVKKNIDFFTGEDDEGHDKKEATMLNIVARKEWGEYDGDWGTYTTGQIGDYKYEAYKVCEEEPDTEPNARIVKKDNISTLGSGFFNLETGSASELAYLSAYTFNNEMGTGEGKFIFTKPLEAIGYHTFFFGKHFNGRSSSPNYGDDYLDYRDSNGGWQRFRHSNTNVSSEWKIGDEDWIDFDDKLNCERDNKKNSNEVNVYFDELNDIITSIKTGKYLRIIGNQAFKLLKNLEEVDLEGSPLEQIGMYAFEGCFGLNTFDMPDSVVLIGEGAFKKSGLSEVKIPSRLKFIEAETFRLCVGLLSVDFSNCTGLTKISANAFRMTGINSLVFPNGLKSIERLAFAQCENLSSIEFNSDLEYVGYRAFDKCNSLKSIEIPAKTIGERAFEKCDNLLEVTIKSSVRTIKPMAFYQSAIETMTIEEGLTTIEDEAFSGCTKLKEITIPNSVKMLGNGAFGRCSDLETVVIGNGVEEIGDDAFDRCGSLKSVTIGNNVKVIGASAFNNNHNLENVVMSDSVEEIKDSAFMGCNKLSSIRISNKCKTIGDSAFCYVSNITSFDIPNSVKTIGASAFAQNKESILESVTIGTGVTSIGTSAFSNQWKSHISNIVYRGTSSQWNRISLGRNWCHHVTATRVYCEGDGTYVNIDCNN